MKRRRGLRTQVSCSLFETGLGTGGVVASDDGLLEVFLPFGGKDSEGMKEEIIGRYPGASAENLLTRHSAVLLTRYFTGEDVAFFDLPVVRPDWTPFQTAVYEAVAAIPFGEVRSYSQVAAEIGRPQAARGVGSAMGANTIPIVIPCHRVVGKSGAMTGYSAVGGIRSKLWLLNMEQTSVKTGSHTIY